MGSQWGCHSLGLPLWERRSLFWVFRPGGRFWICRAAPGGAFFAPLRGALGEPPSAAEIAGSRPGRRPHFLYGQEMGERSRRGPCPLDLRAASGWPSAKVGGALFTDQRTSLQHPASRRAAGAMPLPASLRNRTGSASGEARPLLRGAQRPRGGGKPRGFAAHARRARERPERALFSAVCPRRAIRCALLGAPAT